MKSEMNYGKKKKKLTSIELKETVSDFILLTINLLFVLFPVWKASSIIFRFSVLEGFFVCRHGKGANIYRVTGLAPVRGM